MCRTRLVAAVFAATLLLVQTIGFAQQPLPATGDEAQLLKVLKSDAALFDKAKACQRLAVIGTSKSVPVLAGLLEYKNLSHYARFGLESNPSPDVDKAFRNALGSLTGKPLVGVINSIGVRRDRQAVERLIGAAKDDNQEVAAAAISALGAIASTEAVVAIQFALKGRESLRVTSADACLTAADVLLREGRNAEAAKIFASIRTAELPRHVNIASRFGEIGEDSGNVNDLMTKYLAAKDNDLFRIGLELAHELPGAETTQGLLNQLESLPVRRRALLIYVLGRRGDSTALPAMLAAAESDNVDIKVAAIEVLGTLGDRSVLPVLLKSAVSRDVSLAETATDSLVELQGADVDAELSARLAKSKGRERVVLVKAVGRRGITSAIPMLLASMTAVDAGLRNASIESLGLTVGLKDLPSMLDRLAAGRSRQDADAIRNALRKACQRMPDRDAAATVLLDRMARTSAQAKAELVDLLIYVGGAKALAGIDAAAKGSDDSTADSATQALGKWLTPDVAPVLLDLARTGNRKYRIRCLRGYIRVIRQFGLRANQRLQMSKKAFDTAIRDEERKLVLDTLTRFPSSAGLRMVTPHLNNDALKEEASQAAVSICENIVNTDPKAVAAAIPKVIAATNNREVMNRAKVLMKRVSTE